MLTALRRLVERQILKARAEGKLSGLAGEGGPLPERHDFTDPALAAGHRIMAEAGVLPREFELKKELDAARKAWAASEDKDESRRLMAKIADLEMQYEMEREAYRRFMR